jgi:hypothetical protein
MSFTDLDLDNFLTVKNKIIDLNRAVLINSGNAVNPNDIPTKQYTDDALNKAIATVNIKFNEQKLRIDALTCSLKDASGVKDAGECGKKDAGENGNKDVDCDGNKDTAMIIKKINDEIFRAQQVEGALFANYDALKRQVDIDKKLITQLKQAEETLTAKCDLLQQQLNQLHNYFFGTDASTPPLR